jgi:hypothetical protein
VIGRITGGSTGENIVSSASDDFIWGIIVGTGLLEMLLDAIQYNKTFKHTQKMIKIKIKHIRGEGMYESCEIEAERFLYFIQYFFDKYIQCIS